MTISDWDDYLIHQSAKTVHMMESDDPDAMERLYVGCHNADGTLHFASGLGTYPNRNVMDAYVCIRDRDVQHNLRFSRHLRGDRDKMQVGPLTVEVLEPQKRWCVRIDDNEHGITGSVEFVARGDPHMTAPPSHYDQLGRFTGHLDLRGEHFNLDQFVGARDRSWGIRPAGMFTSPDWQGHFWINVHFPSHCFTLVQGGIWNGNTRCGAAIITDDGNVVPINELRHRIDFEPGLRGLNGLQMRLVDTNGVQRDVSARRISPAIYFNGGGYDRPGEDRGPLSVEYDQWDVSWMPDEKSARFGLHQQIAEFEMDGELGAGILEASFSPDPEREYLATL